MLEVVKNLGVRFLAGSALPAGMFLWLSGTGWAAADLSATKQVSVSVAGQLSVYATGNLELGMLSIDGSHTPEQLVTVTVKTNHANPWYLKIQIDQQQPGIILEAKAISSDGTAIQTTYVPLTPEPQAFAAGVPPYVNTPNGSLITVFYRARQDRSPAGRARTLVRYVLSQSP